MIAQYISELLYIYENVTLPGFGTFELSYTPAKMHPVTHVATPPAKHACYNPSHQANDGILANLIAEKEKISFLEACNKIRQYVEHINMSLAEEKKFTLEKIGTFHISADNALHFTADTTVNYNLESFGMEEIISQPILRDDITERIQKHIAENTRTQKQHKKFPKAAMWTIGIIAATCCSIVVLFLTNPTFFSDLKQGNLFTSKEVPTIKNENPTPVVKEKTTAVDTVVRDTASSTGTEGSYLIVAASFKVKENADNYAVKLTEKGYHSKIIFMEDKAIYVVTYNAYMTKEEAEKDLQTIKVSENNPEAWIIKQ